jgi:ribosome-interacting GTPase 1
MAWIRSHGSMNDHLIVVRTIADFVIVFLEQPGSWYGRSKDRGREQQRVTVQHLRNCRFVLIFLEVESSVFSKYIYQFLYLLLSVALFRTECTMNTVL